MASIDAATTTTSTVRRKDNKVLHLVMSDEFEEDGRSFAIGDDPVFEALNKPDNTNQAIQFYNSTSEYVTTKDGSLVIRTKAVKTSWVEWDNSLYQPVERTKNYTSGMVQTWNKFCFTGGILEMSIQLPGHADSGGLWPAAWLMGNLARATYEKSVQYIWPWSYDSCDGNIQDLPSKQEISACDANPGYKFNPNQGRGAPEIDIFEVMPGHQMPGFSKPLQAFMSTSLQVAPGLPKNIRPKNGEMLNENSTWYKDLKIGATGQYNYGFWGQECGPETDNTPRKVHKYWEDAISVNTNLNASHFESHHVYRLEWQPGKDGYLYWYLDNDLIFGIDGNSPHELTGSLIPQEPMYLIFNTAISHRWGMPEPCDITKCPTCWRCYDCLNPECQCTLPDGMKNCKNLPAEMKIDYVRLYQDKSDPTHSIDCSPPHYPTKDFIIAFSERYEDWKPYTGAFTPYFGPIDFTFMALTIAFTLYLLRHLCFRTKSNNTSTSHVTHMVGQIELESNIKAVQIQENNGKTKLTELSPLIRQNK